MFGKGTKSVCTCTDLCFLESQSVKSKRHLFVCVCKRTFGHSFGSSVLCTLRTASTNILLLTLSKSKSFCCIFSSRNMTCTWLKCEGAVLSSVQYIGNPLTAAIHPHRLSHMSTFFSLFPVLQLVGELVVSWNIIKYFPSPHFYPISLPFLPSLPLNSCLFFLVSLARVSHLSLVSPLLTGGTCPWVPLRISGPLFKSIFMLKSCWKVWVGRASQEGGWMESGTGEVETLQ